MDPYSSHLPVLCCLLKTLKGVPLEVGIGYYSTPIIQSHHGLSLEPERPKDDPHNDWVERLSKTNDYSVTRTIPEDPKQFSFIFIDSYPATSRIHFFYTLRSRSNVFVMHDSNDDGEWEYQYGKIRPYFDTTFDYNPVYPATLIGLLKSDPVVEQALSALPGILKKTG